MIFKDVFSSDLEAPKKLAFLQKSEVTKQLMKMSECPEVKFGSGNRIRNGYMGFVIELSNEIVKQKALSDNEAVNEVFSDDWRDFVGNELDRSNERNSRNLGGRPTSTHSDEDETNQFDVNMDNIMKRFKCFNTIMQNNSSTDDDDKEEEVDELNEPDGEGEGDADNDAEKATTESSSDEKKCEVVIPSNHVVDPEFADRGFWKHIDDADLDDLLADYQ